MNREHIRERERRYREKIKGTPIHDKIVERAIKWGKDPANKQAVREAQARYREKYRLKNLVRSAKIRCRKSGMDFDEQFLLELVHEQPLKCPCCNVELDYTVQPNCGHNPKWKSPSLDRIDNKKGYVRNNVAVICWRCNALKRDATLDEIKSIFEYMKARL